MMSAPRPIARPAPAAAPDPVAWQVAHLSLVFFLDLIALGRQRDVLDALLFGAVLVANLDPINRDPALADTYARLDTVAPDDLRRPVSINAVAQSLRLPFETARRRIMRMAAAGDLVVTARGVYAPAASISTPEFLATIFGRHARLERFYGELRAIGALPASALPASALPAEPAAAASPDPPVRITNRAVAVYMMRVVEAFNDLTADPVTGLLLLQLAHLNTRHLDARAFTAWVTDPTAEGAPVRIGHLARALRYSPETARRHALQLEAAGFCVRRPNGLVAALPAEKRPLLQEIVTENLGNVQRLFTRLRQLGALAGWDQPA